jgi:hypothetical protein
VLTNRKAIAKEIANQKYDEVILVTVCSFDTGADLQKQ